MVDPYKLSLLACVVVAVFYGGLFGILTAWTSSVRWRHSAQVAALAFLRGFLSVCLHDALQAYAQASTACAQVYAQVCAWVFTLRQIVPALRSLQYPRPYPRQYLWQYPQFGNFSMANSEMSMLDAGLETRTDLPAASSASSGSAFPLYTPPTTPPQSSSGSTLVDQRPQEQGRGQRQTTEPAVYRPRDGYIAPQWPPKPKRPHTRTHRYVLASGFIVDIDKLNAFQPPILPWYHDN